MIWRSDSGTCGAGTILPNGPTTAWPTWPDALTGIARFAGDGRFDIRVPDLTRGRCRSIRQSLTGDEENFFMPLAIGQQHDLAEHSAFTQHFVRVASLFERRPS